jgi:hypothetical protein
MQSPSIFLMHPPAGNPESRLGFGHGGVTGVRGFNAEDGEDVAEGEGKDE